MWTEAWFLESSGCMRNSQSRKYFSKCVCEYENFYQRRGYLFAYVGEDEDRGLGLVVTSVLEWMCIFETVWTDPSGNTAVSRRVGLDKAVDVGTVGICEHSDACVGSGVGVDSVRLDKGVDWV